MKKLAIMQPYFLPYIGYWQLIGATDYFVFFDTPQYEQRGWMNRNRILNLTEGFTYITVPIVKAPRTAQIKDILIDNTQSWKSKILSQLLIYKKKAPYYTDAMNIIENIFKREYNFLVDLNVTSTLAVCEYMGINLKYDLSSKLSLSVDEPIEPDEWALYIAKHLGYTSYINAIGGLEFFDRSKYTSQGIDIYFLKPELKKYIQRVGRFEAGLSVLDVMMFNSPDEIREMLEQYTLI